ncbi:MAG TPA: hypothetical protein VLA88_00540 [Candidatus Saccharimonadales bacterium]|nr:hypothetical protein [Candidatus Saccharimonadales bacterium]
MPERAAAPPCEWLPRPEYGTLGDATHRLAVRMTVDYLYPGQADTAESISGIITAEECLYQRALTDHGFMRARYLELGLVVNLIEDCEARDTSWCGACPLADNQGWLEDRLDELAREAAREGIDAAAFVTLGRQASGAAAETYMMIISTLDV